MLGEIETFEAEPLDLRYQALPGNEYQRVLTGSQALPCYQLVPRLCLGIHVQRLCLVASFV
jgi:hypothetical protein